MDLASVYAPSNSVRRFMFFDAIDQHLSEASHVGGDFNVVADVTRDVLSANPLQYPNVGAMKLDEKMDKLHLWDERSAQLGR